MLILRTCKPDMTSYGGFKWPGSGPVEALDWKDNFNCGNGLHGLPWGEGDGSLLNWSEDAKWLVVDVPDKTIKHGEGDMVLKCKFPKGVVLFCGNRKEATEYLINNGGSGKAIVGAMVVAGDRGTATAGYRGTATAGDGGVIQLKWWDGKRYRIETAYIGENGIKKETAYKLDESHKFVIK